MSTCGLRGCVVGCKKANVGEWGHVGWKADILGVFRRLFGGQPSTMENFCNVPTRHLLWWAYPWARGRGRREREKERKKCVRNCL
jgi:hypothetical protein